MQKVSAPLNDFGIYSRQIEHRIILENMSELMVLVTLKRPTDVTTFKAQNLSSIAKNHRNASVCFKFRNSFEQSNSIHRYAKIFNCPVIEFKSTNKTLNKYAKLTDMLQQNSMSYKNDINALKMEAVRQLWRSFAVSI